MALINSQAPLNQYDFSGGINIAQPGHLIGDIECYANIPTYDGTKNCYWNVGIKKRLGTLKVNSVAVTSKLVNGIRFYRSTTPLMTTIIASDYITETKIFYLDSGSPPAFVEIAAGAGSTAFDTGADITFAKWKDSLYIAGGTTGNAVIQKITYSAGWVRTDIVDLTAKPQIVCAHRDRLWAAGGDIPEGQLWCSSYDDETEWSGAGTSAVFNIGYQDGDPIVALVSLGNDLIIYKNNSIWAMVGDNAQNWSEQKRIDNSGCSAAKSVVNVIGMGHIFIGSDNMYLYDGTTLTPIGNNIKPWLDVIPLSLRKNCAATYYNNYYRIAFPSSDMSTCNNKELLLDLKYLKTGRISWWIYDGRNIAAYIPYTGPQDTNILTICDGVVGYLREIDVGMQDDGADYEMQFHSKYFVFDQPNTEKNYDRLKIDHSLGIGILTVIIVKNLNDEYTMVIPIDASGASNLAVNATLDQTYWSSQANTRQTSEIAIPSEFDGYALSYTISHATNEENTTFYGFTISYKYKRY
jgi:hypothetical protein